MSCGDWGPQTAEPKLDLVQRVHAFTRAQTGANFLASVARDTDLARTIIAVTSPDPADIALADRLADVAKEARTRANWAKLIGSLWLFLAFVLLTLALLWPLAEKLILKWPESMLTGVGQIVLAMFGSLAAGGYLAAKRPQSRIEDALRRMLFEHGPIEARVERARRAITGDDRAAAAGDEALRPKPVWSFATATDVRHAFEPRVEHQLRHGELVVIAAQLKEIGIKHYGWATISRVAAASATALFLAAWSLPWVATAAGLPLDQDLIGSMQPIVGIAVPVFFLAIRQQALRKQAQVEDEIAKSFELTEPLETKTARGIAIIRSVDRGMTAFVEQAPPVPKVPKRNSSR